MKNISKMDTPDASTLTNVMRNLGGCFQYHAIIATLLDNKTREHLAHIKSPLLQWNDGLAANAQKINKHSLFNQEVMPRQQCSKRKLTRNHATWRRYHGL